MVTMRVERDGYYDGQYARVGDVITVPDDLVDVVTRAGFAVRTLDAPPKPKGKSWPTPRSMS